MDVIVVVSVGEMEQPNPSPQITVAGLVCLDIIPDWPASSGLADLTPGKLLEVGPATVSTGGSVSNTGLALHRLGVPVQLMGKVGDDAIGRLILDLLARASESPQSEPARPRARREGGALSPGPGTARLTSPGPGWQPARLTDGMIVAPGEPSSYTVVISPPRGDRMFLHCPGANHTFAADDVDYGRLAGPDMKLFHFGYPPLMQRMFAGGGEQLERMLGRVGELGLTTSLDMARVDPASPAGRVDWPALLGNVLPRVDLFLPSLDETLFMLDRDALDRLERSTPPGGLAAAVGIERIGQLADQLLKMGAAVVALKLGDQGLYVRTTSDRLRLASAGKAFSEAMRDTWLGRELLAPCFEVEVAGTTGAGDCTIAGFLAGLLAGLGLGPTAVFATAVGACSVEQPDATSGVPHWSSVVQRLEAGWRQRAVNIDLPGWRGGEGQAVWFGPETRSPSGRG